MGRNKELDKCLNGKNQIDVIHTMELFSKLESSLFQLIVDNVPDLIWAKNMNDEYLFVNQAMCENLLMINSTNDAIGKKDVYFADKERRAGFDHTFGEICVNSDQIVKKSRQSGRFVEKGRVRGEYLVLDVHKAPFFDKTDKMIGTVGCGRDITNQKKFEAQLQRSREQFISVLDNLTSAVYVVDIQTCEILFINQTLAGYFGKSSNQFIGKTCWKVLMKDRANPCTDCNNHKVLQENGLPADVHVSEYKNEWLNKVFEVSNQAIKWSDGRLVKLTIATDVTAKKQAIEALIENEKRFRTLFNGIEDAIFVHPFKDKGFSNFIEVNDVACKRYGYSRDEFKKLSSAILQAKTKNSMLIGGVAHRKKLKKQGQLIFENEHIKKNGDTFPVEVSSTLFDFHGEQMILSTIRDITDRKMTEKEREDAMKFASEQEKYALVGQIAGKMAHDFNNILGGIMGHAEISLMDCQEKETLESLNIILEQTIRGKSLTQNLVAFAKDQEPKEEYFNVNSKVDLAINLLKKDLYDAIIIREYKSNLPELLADPGMIEHALVNLVQNAIHAMSLVKKPKLKIKTYAKKEKMFIEIKDNGCGIPKENFDDIYSPSFTLKGSRDFTGAYRSGIKGTGYGMSNVKKYIEKHKGSIRFKSSVNKGSTFTLSIPIIKKELTKKEKQSILKRQIQTCKRILLVEDEPAISAVQQKILTHKPFCHHVKVATTAQMAMDAFDEQDFDLVSLDYLLPGNLNGLDVYKYIRKKDQKIPIVFVSGNFEFLESMKEISSTDSQMDHISKPCGNIVYVSTINKWLENR
ncbi:MAG: PAS domain S-box protein [Desulfobacula sp.]|nr:PAS domain S-box protein [Desulfobacula sp.]